MALTLVGSAKGTNTATAPTTAAGDIMVVCATRNASATPPTVPAGFTTLTGGGTANTNSIVSGWKICTASDTTGTWTNATETICTVLRPASGHTAYIGSFAYNAGSSTTATYSAITAFDGTGASWGLLFGQTKSQTVGIQNTPSGFTARQDELGTGELAYYDTNGGVSSFSSHTQTLSPTNVWKTLAVEVIEVVPSTGISNIVSRHAFGVNSPALSNETDSAYKFPISTKPTLNGNAIGFWLSYNSGSTVSTIADDSGSNSWSTTPKKTITGGGMVLSYFAIFNAAPAQYLTVTFNQNTQPVAAIIKQYFNVTGFDSGVAATTSTTAVSPAVLACGSFTPGNANCLIDSFFGIAGTNSGVNVSLFTKGAGFTLTNSDVACTAGQGWPKASQALLQGTAAAINPSMLAAHTGTLDAYNCMAVALTTGSQGAQQTGIFANSIDANPNSAIAGGNQVIAIPSTGNTGAVVCFGGYGAQTATDSDGVTWTKKNSSDDTRPTWYYRENYTASDVRTLTINFPSGAGSPQGMYWHDIQGAQTPSSFDVQVSNAATGVTNGATSIADQPDITPTVSGDLVLFKVDNGLGPTPAITVPAAASYMFPFYSRLADGGMMDFGNGLAAYYAPNTNLIATTWTLASGNVTSGSYVSGTGVVTINCSFFDSAFAGNDIFITLTGTGSVATISGHFVVATDDGTGTHFTYTGTTGLTLSITGGTITQFNVSVSGSAIAFKAPAQTQVVWGFNEQTYTAIRRKSQLLAAMSRNEDPIWPITVTATPSQFGWNVEPQFARRNKPRPDQRDDQGEAWPFTATGTPTQFGWNVEPQFPIKRKPQVLAIEAKESETWPFTAVPTPAQVGWDNPEHFPLRQRVVLRNPSGDEIIVIPITAPVILSGWNIDPQFPERRRFQPFQPDEPTDQWPFTEIAAPTQFGWNIDPQFPERRKFQPFQPDEPTDQWPTTVTITPSQFGWNVEATFPERRRWQASLRDADITVTAPGALTPSQFSFDYNPQFPERRKFQPFQPDEPTDQWPLTAVLTPGPLGWETPTLQVMRIRPRPVFHGDPDPIIIPPPLPPGPARLVRALIVNVGRLLNR